MSDQALDAWWDATRALCRDRNGRGLIQDEVDAFNVILATWAPAARKVCVLADPQAFFGGIRTAFGGLDQGQVDGFNRLLAAMGPAGWPIPFAAYGLVTGWHETNHQMTPVEEGYYLGDRAAAFQRGLKYYPWFGRGDVQLTWERNYKRADDELGLGGRLIANPALALDPEISAKVLVRGMEQGWFTGKKLADYLPSTGTANAAQFVEARRIINGTDKAQQIAGQAMKIQSALVAGGWA